MSNDVSFSSDAMVSSIEHESDRRDGDASGDARAGESAGTGS